MSIKVAKFGGTSLADDIQLVKIKNIIDDDPDIKYVVVSAPGKRFKADNKVTDLLYGLKTLKDNNLPYDQTLDIIKSRFDVVMMHLGIRLDLSKEYEKIVNALESGADKDHIASRGEYLNALVTAEYLGFDFVDAADLIRFDERGRFLEEETNINIAEKLSEHEHAVIPGFYGSRPDGRIRTFSRGGSDITGALVARAVGADLYENWTDVSGFMITDPRIVPNAKHIENITYRELRELSHMGASVLHEDAIYPARKAGIPIVIKNTELPEHPGTLITEEVAEHNRNRIVTGFAGRKGFSLFSIRKKAIDEDRGFYRKLTGLFEDRNIRIVHLLTGEDSAVVIVKNDDLGEQILDIIDDLTDQLRTDNIEFFEEVALVAAVGEGMRYIPGVYECVLDSLTREGIETGMIYQGLRRTNIIVAVLAKDYDRAIRTIYKALEKHGSMKPKKSGQKRKPRKV
ncbi:MAG: aspartate kinase [Anaerovoracaceae bacterium]|nr:aspartate kinase [Anaerovoracaceae bacterium]